MTVGYTMPEIRAALRRHLVSELAGITVTMPDASTAAPKVHAFKAEPPKRREDLPFLNVLTPESKFGKGDDCLEYRKASIDVDLVLLLGLGGSETEDDNELGAVLMDALDEGFLQPVQERLALATGLGNQAAAGSPLCAVWYPDFVEVETRIDGEGEVLYGAAVLTVRYDVEAVYERVPGGAPDDDFATLAGPIDTGEPEADQQVLVETQQP